jgi:CBS domain containing-hemolysin-like protein
MRHPRAIFSKIAQSFSIRYQSAMEELPLSLRPIVLFVLLAINSFFAAAEVALVSVRETRMRELAQGGDHRARTVLDLLAKPDRMLSATQLGVTLASLGLGWAGESTVYSVLEPLFRPLITPGTEAYARIVSFALAFTLITFLHMVLGEVVPKNLALERTERLALMIAGPMNLFTRMTSFFVSLVEGTSRRISRVLGLKMNLGGKGYTAEELKLVVSLSKKEGALAHRQDDMLHRVIDFYDLGVREVMVPRQEMVSLPMSATFDQVVECIVRQHHSRIPVYEESPEHVVGVVYAKELWLFVQQMRRWQMLDRPPPAFLLRPFVHAVEFVPETKFVYEMLEEFLERRYHMAMVVDEFGTVVGLVTVEDALEQIVGEIRDEHERPKAAEVRPPGGPIEVDGITPILDLATRYEIELPYDAGFETLAGFLLSKLGRIPEGGEKLEYQGHTYTVTQMENNRISRVRIDPSVDRLIG